MDKLPIIYIRGFAGGTSGIDGQVDDPFYGFNKGSTHVRVGGDGDPLYYQFEGPLLRLINDEGYQLIVRGDQAQVLLDPSIDIPSASVWVYRFYDQAATTFQAPRHESLLKRPATWIHERLTSDGFDIEQAAAGLYDLVELVLGRTGADRVILVAHSMGGLIARSMIQKVCFLPDERKPKGQQQRKRPTEIVARLFTYATPHGGITSSGGVAQWIERVFNPAGADIFAPHLMQGYLDPGMKFGDPCTAQWDPQRVDPQVFPLNDIFCLVGTDPTDYGWGPRTVVGPKSDGLVRIEHAYIRGAHRAYVHKSHSGPYGEVNSEEGYQNLRRFLFGRWSVSVAFDGLADATTGPTWQADMRLAIRGVSVVMSEQTVEHYCPILLDQEAAKADAGVTAAGTAAEPAQDTEDSPVPLVSTFLLDPGDRAESGTVKGGPMRYTLTLRVFQVDESHGSFSFQDHLEQVPDWADSLIIDVQADASRSSLTAWAAWNSSVSGANAQWTRITDGLPESERAALTFEKQGSELVTTVPLPASALGLPIFTDRAALKIIVSSRVGEGAQGFDGLQAPPTAITPDQSSAGSVGPDAQEPDAQEPDAQEPTPQEPGAQEPAAPAEKRWWQLRNPFSRAAR